MVLEVAVLVKAVVDPELQVAVGILYFSIFVVVINMMWLYY